MHRCPWGVDAPCGKTFASPSLLEMHVCGHLGLRQFTCPEDDCGEAFITATGLRHHGVVHSGERAFMCTTGLCKRGFTRKAHQQGHERICGRRTRMLVEDQIIMSILDKDIIGKVTKGSCAGKEVSIWGRSYLDPRRGGFLTTAILGADSKQIRPDLLVCAKGWGSLWLEVDEDHHYKSHPGGDFERMRRMWLEFLLPRSFGPVHVIRFRTTNARNPETPEGINLLHQMLASVIRELDENVDQESPCSSDLNIYYVNSPRETHNILEAKRHDNEAFKIPGTEREAMCKVYV